MNRIIVGLIANAAIAVASPASASVVYDFTGSGPSSFTLTTDTFITSTETIAAADLDSCSIVGIACDHVVFDFIGSKDSLSIVGVGAAESGTWIFASGSFGSDGTFLADANFSTGPGTLVVTSGVPEPSTWAMMLFGFGLVGLALRRRRRRQLANATA